MNSFFNYIQPTIVRLANVDDDRVPSDLAGRYMVNLNIVGIKYFIENYLLMEDPDTGSFMYMLTDEGHKLQLEDDGTAGAIDIPRAYIKITPEFANDQTAFSEWLVAAIADNSYYITGTDSFKPGRDYYLNGVMYEFLLSDEAEVMSQNDISAALLPNYLTNKFERTKWWMELDDELARYNNFRYFEIKNRIMDMRFSEEELYSLRSTFFRIIKDDTIVSEMDMYGHKNQIYKAVIDYYANGKTDCAAQLLVLILKSTISAMTLDMSATNCGCHSTASATGSLDTADCPSLYGQAMVEWMTRMLGDVDFYKDWMYFTDPEGQLDVNDALIEELIELLENFLDADIDISSTRGQKKIYNHCICGTGSLAGDSDNAERRKIIEDYIMLLKWVQCGCIDEHTNKIAVIGRRFAGLIDELEL